MTGIEELTGLPVDPDCLHCHLPPLINAWMESHPQVSVEQVIIQLAQSLGEVIGTAAPDVSCADRMALGALRFVRTSAREIATAMKGAPS